VSVIGPLTIQVIDGYLHCRYLGLLRSTGQRGEISDYGASLGIRRSSVRAAALGRIVRQFSDHALASGILLTPDVLRGGAPFLLDADLQRDDISIRFDGLQRVPGPSALGDFHYVPVLFVADRHLHRTDKALLEFLGLLLSDVQGAPPRYGLVYHGSDCRLSRVRISTDLRGAKSLMGELSRLQRGEVQPRLVLNDHCPTCEFCTKCHEQALREDNLSLLRGLGQKAITAYARKGILTLTQLAHTFRPRRKGKRSGSPSKKRYFALQALALRDRRVYVLGTPDVPTGEVRIYLDLEGTPDDGFVYLIGMIVCEGATQTAYSFWADSKDQEGSIFEAFLAVVARYQSPRVYAYGGYERAFLKRMRRISKRKKLVDKIVDGLVNVLGIIYTHFYFPTYTNGLKEIGGVLGCTWSEEHASGIQSILWRRHWEITQDEMWKAKLLTYNNEDCKALRTVMEFLQAPANLPSTSQVPTVVPVNELDRLAYAPKWGVTNFANPDFAAINSRAYFDYQQHRVFIRTSKTLRKHLRKPGTHHNLKLRVNKRIEVTSTRCPKCKSNKLHTLSQRESAGMRVRTKRSLDLFITSTGMRRRVTECRPKAYRCESCGHRFKPERYHRVATHGHALMSWAMHAHIAHRFSNGTIANLLREFFALSVTDSEIHMFKGLVARRYRKTYDGLLAKLASGTLLHVDETEVQLRTGKGYVWVFASIEEVAYVYKPSREGEFLKNLLQHFHGVLVSDFYAAYDAIVCPQQKCLIHLMRDLNQALLANPFDDEVHFLTQPFGTLLREIVTTVDEYGLKHHRLARHQKGVTEFFTQIRAQNVRSEAAQAIRDRLLKYQDKLFTFIHYDGVPWNNNNAENAIKQFAYYRENRSGIMKESGLKEYLVLLSVFQTCRCKGLSFLQFLLSGEQDIDTFATTKRRRRPPVALALYPKNFNPPHFAKTKAGKQRSVK
jgi:predicted RecB family nuclease